MIIKMFLLFVPAAIVQVHPDTHWWFSGWLVLSESIVLLIMGLYIILQANDRKKAIQKEAKSYAEITRVYEIQLSDAMFSKQSLELANREFQKTIEELEAEVSNLRTSKE